MSIKDTVVKQLQEYLEKDGISFSSSSTDVIEFEVTVQNINLEFTVFSSDLFTVSYTLVPLNISQENLEIIYKLMNYLNSNTPFGNFEYDLSASSLYYRISLVLEERGVTYEIYDHLLNYPLFTIETYMPFLNGVNSGLLSLEDAITKIDALIEIPPEDQETKPEISAALPAAS